MNPANEFLAAAAYHFEQNRPLIPMYLHLLLSALFPIYTGAHASLSRPSSAAKPKKKAPREVKEEDDDDEEDEEEEKVEKMEGLTASDALIFPLTAGLVLSALYFLIKRYGAVVINRILGGYFSLIGTYSVAKLLNDSLVVMQGFITPTYYYDQAKVWKLSGKERKAVAAVGKDDKTKKRTSPLPGPLGRLPQPEFFKNMHWGARDMVRARYVVQGYAKDAFDFRVVLTRVNMFSAVLGLAIIGYSVFYDKPWYLTNVQGFAVCYGALQFMSPTTFMTGTLILSGLFFYDIWAVFFTPLMVTVAKNLDVPIKLVFPRPEEPSEEPGKPPVQSFSMLGLGDIVLPGLMIALALRFDLYIFYRKKQTTAPTSTAVSDKDEKDTENITKAPWVPITGNWGDKFWTSWAPSSAELPKRLRTSFPKIYFTATVIGYVIGMVATLVFMSVFQHAQPALLYLVPAVLISLWGTGLVRGELKEMWEFTESIDGQPDMNAEDNKQEESRKEEKGQSEDEESTSILSFFGGIFGFDSPAAEKKMELERLAAEKAKQERKDAEEEKAKSQKGSGGEQQSPAPKPGKNTKKSVNPDMILSFSITRAGRKRKDTSTTEAKEIEKEDEPIEPKTPDRPTASSTDVSENNGISESISKMRKRQSSIQSRLYGGSSGNSPVE